MSTQQIKQCNSCGQDFTWKKPYDGTKLNIDGTVHECKSKSKSSGIARHPIGQAPEFLEMACTLLETLEEKEKLKLPVNERAATVARLFDTVSRSYTL